MINKTNQQNGIKAGNYYTKLAKRKGKLFRPKDDLAILSNTISKYGLSNIISDECFNVILESDSSSMRHLLTNLDLYYGKQTFENVNETILLKLSSDTLYNIYKDFFFVHKEDAVLLRKMAEICLIDGKIIDKFSINLIDDLLKKKEKKGYDYKFLYDTFAKLLNKTKDNYNLAKIVNKYDFLHDEPTDLIYELIVADTKSITSYFDSFLKKDGDYDKLMYLLEDSDAISILKENYSEIDNLSIRSKIEKEREKDIFDDLYISIFEDNKLKENSIFSKETCLSAIESNIPFLCSDYVISYNNHFKGYDPSRVNKAAVALSTYLKEKNDLRALERINEHLDDLVRNTFEEELHYNHLDIFSLFDEGSNAELYIEEVLLANPNLYYQAKKEAENTNLKVNEKMVEKVTYNLVRFPPEKMLKNEANSRIIFTMNNEFAKERMRKKSEIHK